MSLEVVYSSRRTGAVLDAVDIGQIWVLRGPQGTLYGKNTIGGAINITSRRPDNAFGGYVQLTTGRFGRIDATARVDIPLSDSIRTAVSFASLHRSEERRAGKECVSPCRSRWSPYPHKKKTNIIMPRYHH